MIYDYQDQEGYVSLWVGNCEDYDTLNEEAKGLEKPQIPKCNAAVALYDFRFTGDIVKAEHENVSLYFVEYVKYKE